ncbi:hypothetical protein PL81_05385 [Streptomyces sp. RSD-27]|nr:hypothetical protein PL81_05385 [Streptomyces sp. RSD-27]
MASTHAATREGAAPWNLRHPRPLPHCQGDLACGRDPRPARRLPARRAGRGPRHGRRSPR